MHELFLTKDLLRKIEAIAGPQRVVRVKVTLGALAHISAAHFRENFVEAAAGTVADGAHLEIQELTDPTDPGAQDIRLESVEVVE